MSVLISSIKNFYDYVFLELQDERTRSLFPAAWVLIILLPFYVHFIRNVGPRLMKDRPPFDLRSVIFYFNIFQIFICSYIMVLLYKGGWFNGYSFSCQPVDITDNPKTRTMINAIWWYTVVKLIDLLDTVFFVLRKKDRQISFLHLFHHTGMPIVGFIGLKYYPNGHSTLLGFLNCFVHIIMYTYYLIAGMGPKYQKYLWWKRYVTVIQIIQFLIIFIHNAVALFDRTCTYPKWVSAGLCIFSVQFVYLFGSFYYENYILKPRSTAEEKQKEVVTNGIHSDGHLKTQ